MEVLLHQLWDLLPIVLTILAGVVTRYAVPFLKSLASRANLELSARQEAYVQYVVKQAVLGAEEAIEAAFKAKTIEYVEKGEAKLQAAMEEIGQKLPFLSDEQKKALINAALRQLDLGASALAPFVQGTIEDFSQQAAQ